MRSWRGRMLGMRPVKSRAPMRWGEREMQILAAAAIKRTKSSVYIIIHTPTTEFASTLDWFSVEHASFKDGEGTPAMHRIQKPCRLFKAPDHLEFRFWPSSLSSMSSAGWFFFLTPFAPCLLFRSSGTVTVTRHTSPRAIDFSSLRPSSWNSAIRGQAR